MRKYVDNLLGRAKKLKSRILWYAAQQPMLALFLVLVCSVLLLPLVTATALFPVVMIFKTMDYLQAKGLLTLTYLIFGQGILLAIIIAILLVVTLSLITGVSIIHHKCFQSVNTVS